MRNRASMAVLLAGLLAGFAVAADGVAVVPERVITPERQSRAGDELDAVTIPRLLSFQGRLADTLGTPVPNGTYPVVFRLYSVPSGGSSFWNETQNVTTKDGLFTVLLGSVTPVGSLPDAGAAYIGMAVSGGAELAPRLRLVSAAYSYLTERAAGADLLQGKDTTGFVRAGQSNSVTSAMITDGTIAAGDIGTGAVTSVKIADGTIAAADLNQMGAAVGQVMKWNGTIWRAQNDSVGGGTGDNAWVRGTPDSVLYTVRNLGIARGGVGNVLHGSSRFTHVNLGAACTTGASGQNYSHATVGGGSGNMARGGYTAVAGGESNAAFEDYSTVSGGRRNATFSTYSTVGGGFGDTASGQYSTVAGGYMNTASGERATVGGGYLNRAANSSATVAGGNTNTASGVSSTVAGGNSNTASGNYAAVVGGFSNYAGGQRATVGGGEFSQAMGTCCYAAGRYARANHRGSFVWSDSAVNASESVYTTAENQFRVRARGGTWFFSNAGQSTGAYLAAGSNSWASACDSATKTDFRDVDRRELLEKLAALRVREYRMRDQQDGTRHIGPVAQDFAAAFGMGENNTTINMADMDGVTLAAIQALYEQNQALSRRVNELEAKLGER